MLQKISFKNFGPFREAELRLAPLTVLVGPNSSGKSTVLEAIHETCRAGEVRHLLRRKRTRNASDPSELLVEDADGHSWSWHSGEIVEAVNVNRFRALREEQLPRSVIFRLNPDAIRQPSQDPEMTRDGRGLPSLLANMKLLDDPRQSKIIENARAIVPSLENVRIKRAKLADGQYGDELVFDMKNAPDLPPSMVSDGTLCALAILAGATAASRPGDDRDVLVLIDELEHSLHPKALEELVGQLRRLTETTGIQILATSHSPYLVNWLKPDEVRITGFLEDGSATIRELSDAPEYERWKDVMTPGEIWSTIGEDWIR